MTKSEIHSVVANELVDAWQRIRTSTDAEDPDAVAAILVGMTLVWTAQMIKGTAVSKDQLRGLVEEIFECDDL
jgi:hypothetical protein